MLNAALAENISEYGLSRCYRCGACSAACPMRSLYPDFPFKEGPRSTIARLLLLNTQRHDVPLARLFESNGLWMCLTCEVCNNACPQGVKFRDFVERLRGQALMQGMTEKFALCSHCAKPYLPKAVVEALGRFLPENEPRDILLTCPQCRRRVYGGKLRSVDLRRAETSLNSS